ncbi:hypothetical protein ACFZC5_36255 [Nocardia gamkensis]|uniref:hypothetical protein n=1 Tax=Nocardia gamkensis TaxID=352869 RepID=UPI0036EF4F0F
MTVLGVPRERIFVDKGFSGTTRRKPQRPGQRAHRRHLRRSSGHRPAGGTDHHEVRPVRPQHGRGRPDPDQSARARSPVRTR